MLTCGSAHVGVIAAMVPSTTVSGDADLGLALFHFLVIGGKTKAARCAMMCGPWVAFGWHEEGVYLLFLYQYKYIRVVNNRLRMRPHIYIGRL